MNTPEPNPTVDFGQSESSHIPAQHRFHSTHWSVVNRAGDVQDSQHRQALESLFQAYWYPLYAFARRSGQDPHQAEDLTQAFFAKMLEKDFVSSADPERGKFRTFLLVMFKRFMINEYEHGQTQRQGGRLDHLSLDIESSEQRYALEPSDDWTPERLFDRQWAITLLNSVMSQLEAEHQRPEQRKLFRKLRGFLGGGRETPYAEIAQELEIPASSLRVTVHRLRLRYREILRLEIAQTLDDPSEIDEELGYLRAAIRA